MHQSMDMEETCMTINIYVFVERKTEVKCRLSTLSETTMDALVTTTDKVLSNADSLSSYKHCCLKSVRIKCQRVIKHAPVDCDCGAG